MQGLASIWGAECAGSCFQMGRGRAGAGLDLGLHVMREGEFRFGMPAV